ncbi:MAG TPA: hypothetical protein VMZ31_00975 [Phycisphaerae bacterium]|nr:hypothetical protein [Phycisphaerae bacterium]
MVDTRELDACMDRLVTEVARWKDSRRDHTELDDLRYILTRHLRDLRLARESVGERRQPQSPSSGASFN